MEELKKEVEELKWKVAKLESKHEKEAEELEDEIYINILPQHLMSKRLSSIKQKLNEDRFLCLLGKDKKDLEDCLIRIDKQLFRLTAIPYSAYTRAVRDLVHFQKLLVELEEQKK